MIALYIALGILAFAVRKRKNKPLNNYSYTSNNFDVKTANTTANNATPINTNVNMFEIILSAFFISIPFSVRTKFALQCFLTYKTNKIQKCIIHF